MRKPYAALIAMLMMTLSFATPAFAINLAPSVKLASVSIPLEYAPADIEIVRVVDYERNEVRASVFDKSSGSIIESYSETPDIPLRTLESIQSSSDGEQSNYNMVMQKTRTIASPNGKNVSTIVWAEVNITAGQSWGQIERVNATGQNAQSGSYSLESPHTYSQTTRFPTNTISIGYQGTVLVTNSNSLGISFGGAQLAGFSVSGSASSTWYARKFYSSSVSMDLMIRG